MPSRTELREPAGPVRVNLDAMPGGQSLNQPLAPSDKLARPGVYTTTRHTPGGASSSGQPKVVNVIGENQQVLQSYTVPPLGPTGRTPMNQPPPRYGNPVYQPPQPMQENYGSQQNPVYQPPQPMTMAGVAVPPSYQMPTATNYSQQQPQPQYPGAYQPPPQQLPATRPVKVAFDFGDKGQLTAWYDRVEKVGDWLILGRSRAGQTPEYWPPASVRPDGSPAPVAVLVERANEQVHLCYPTATDIPWEGWALGLLAIEESKDIPH